MYDPILIVEDDAIAQLTLSKQLEKLGVNHIDIVDNGREAIEKVKQNKYYCCFMDIRIKGGLDGIETSREINKISDLAIIYLTASSEKQTFNRAMETRHQGFIIKPCDKDLIAKHLGRITHVKSKYEDIKSDISTQVLDLIYDTADIGMCLTDRHRNFVKVNKAYCKTYGYSEMELIGKSFLKVLPENIREYAGDLHDRFIAGTTEESAGEWQVYCKDGSIKDIYVTAARLNAPNGEVYKVTTVSDITEKKRHTQRLERALSEKEDFIREVHHRVKNNLNTVSGLLFLQAEKVENKPGVYQLFMESIQRIKTLSSIHERLYSREKLASIDFKEYLENLCESISYTYKREENPIALDFHSDAIELNMDQSISCGLIVNEILSNAFKYAFPENKQGTIQVKVTNSSGEITVKIQDDGVGLPSDFSIQKANSLGMQLIHNLSRQLNAHLEIESHRGTQFTLLFNKI